MYEVYVVGGVPTADDRAGDIGADWLGRVAQSSAAFDFGRRSSQNNVNYPLSSVFSSLI